MFLINQQVKTKKNMMDK